MVEMISELGDHGMMMLDMYTSSIIKDSSYTCCGEEQGSLDQRLQEVTVSDMFFVPFT
jgi:hypothetical protein